MDENSAMSSPKPFVRVTQIGEYIRHHSCERRFKLDQDNRALTKALPFFYTLSSAMDPALAEAGRQREHEWQARLTQAGLRDIGSRNASEAMSWATFAARAAALPPGTAAFAREIEVMGEVGAFRLIGRIDFALVLWRNGQPVLRLVECKASRRDQTYQRVQLALYRLLVPDPVAECVVARIDAETNQAQDILALPPLDLTLETADALAMLDPKGPLQALLPREIDEIPYQLDSKCDDCAFNVYCLPEAARRRDLELLGMGAGEARALRTAGIMNIDALAALTAESESAQSAQADPAFGASLDVLVQKAKARMTTLPGGKADPEGREVSALPDAGSGHLPPHVTSGQRLARVFLSVNFDYIENRVGAVAAHVTRSDRPLSTLFAADDAGKWRPDPDVREQWKDTDGVFQDRPMQGTEIVGIIAKPWTGDFEHDSASEARMLSGFFQKVVAALAEFCPEGRAPIHFYVWSQNEISRLVESCARAGGDLLGSLQELLGCREGLEQLLSSSLSEEVNRRYALGWTSRGLAAAAGLRWYGRAFHWTRHVGEETVALDRIFREGIFDFQTMLPYDDDGHWDAQGPYKHLFEVRAAFGDALPAPYWRAYWGTLPDPEATGTDVRVRTALRAYTAAGKPNLLRAYLKARVQALRWIEEGIRDKNTELVKPSVEIAKLPSFTLGVGDAARAALDFLRLEQHVAANVWLTGHFLPPARRVPMGRTLPVRDVHAVCENEVAATLDLTGYPVDKEALQVRSGVGVGAFIRLSPCAEDPKRGQTLGQLLRGGSTGRIETLDWVTGAITLRISPYRRESRYIWPSRAWPVGCASYARATLDESVTDFVAGRIDSRLTDGFGSHVARWFDPAHPEIPIQRALPPAQMAQYERLLADLNFGHGPLTPDQRAAALAGLNARVQLLQGPPGTGKTQTTAAALLLRIAARLIPGDIVLVTGNTHTAVDTLLERVRSLLPACAERMALPPLCIEKTDGAPLASSPNVVQVLGGTPNALLKLGQSQDLQTSLLVVDEASMMVLPHFLAVVSMVNPDGAILLAGDHRQLAPILAHDWEREERPPARQYRPHVSAYEAVRALKRDSDVPDAAITRSALTYTFRLPPVLRDLIGRLYQLDGLTLTGREDHPPALKNPPAPNSGEVGMGGSGGQLWQCLWQNETGLFLVVHDERGSRQSNPVEAQIIQEILEAAGANLPPKSVGVVVPHRAQRGLLQASLRDRAAVDVIDTVERFQGGERETMFVSATASDPSVIADRAEFLLGLNRANVAFSRARKRLVVVCSASLLASVPPQTDHYAEAFLWKSLRALCSQQIGETTVEDHAVRVYSPSFVWRTGA
jgi:hypothetical protein